MADNIFYLEDLLTLPSHQATDDGSGTDWFIINGTYPMLFGHWGMSVYMFQTAPFSTNIYFHTLVNGSLVLDGATIFGQIENAQGGGGDEEIVGGDIANMIVGDPDGVAGGHDALFGNGGADTMLGGGGSDWLHGDDDNDLMFGDFDPNSYPATNFVPGDDTLFGDNGNDTLSGGRGTNSLDGGAGYDTADYSGFFDDFGTTTYRIVAYLQAGTVVVYAKDEFGLETIAASDTVTGCEVIYGTAGADIMQGNYNFVPGDFMGNVLHGGAGNDVLTGTNGVDALFGGDGVDLLDDYDNNIPGASGVDLLNGGMGDDYYFVRNASTVILETATGGYDRVTVNVSYTLPAFVEGMLLTSFGGPINGIGNASDNMFEGSSLANDISGLGGHDYALGLAGNDTLRGGFGDDSLYGGTEDDLLTGGSQNDVLSGDAGADLLYGGSENDKLYGGSQDDFLQGGLGHDVLRGGSGADTFYFAAAAESAGRNLRDSIEDFRTNQDHIDLHRIAKNQVFIGTAAFDGSGNAEVRYDAATGILSGDSDGNGTANYQINLAAGTILIATDLIL